jgi:hypothetical protein
MSYFADKEVLQDGYSDLSGPENEPQAVHEKGKGPQAGTLFCFQDYLYEKESKAYANECCCKTQVINFCARYV